MDPQASIQLQSKQTYNYITSAAVLFRLLKDVLSNDILFGTSLYGAFDNMGKTSWYVKNLFANNHI